MLSELGGHRAQETAVSVTAVQHLLSHHVAILLDSASPLYLIPTTGIVQTTFCVWVPVVGSTNVTEWFTVEWAATFGRVATLL